MNQCLRDRTLQLLYEGDGTSEERSHLAGCDSCTAKFRRLGHDLKVIGEVLREGPPPEAVSHRPDALAVRWLPTAAVLVFALAMVWGGMLMWSPSTPPPLGQTLNERIWELFEEVPVDLILPDDAIAEEAWPLIEDIDILWVVSGEEWLGEWID